MTEEPVKGLQGYLPLATAIAAVGSVTYAGGFMRYAGTSWIGMFQLTDIFALSWPAVSILSVAILAGDALGRITERGPVRTVEDRGASARPIEGINIWLVGVVVVSVLGARLANALPAQYGVFAVLVPLIATGLLLRSRVKRRMSREQGLAAIGVLAISAAYCAGLSYGSLPFSSSPNAVVETTAGNIICGNIVTPMSRGILIVAENKSVNFVEWSRVEAVRSNVRCAEGANPSA